MLKLFIERYIAMAMLITLCAVGQAEIAAQDGAVLPLSESSLAEFQAAVEPEFSEFAAARYALEFYIHLPEEQKNQEEEETLRNSCRNVEVKLLEQIESNWPYDFSGSDEMRENVKDEEEMVRALYNDVHDGFSTREEVVSELLRITEEYPQTPLAGFAYWRAAYLHWNADPRDEDQFYGILRDMIDSDVPLCGHTIMALENIATDADSNQERFENRKEFSAYLTGLHDPAVLSEALLIPLSYERPTDFIFRIRGTISRIEGSYYINSLNLIGESMLTEDPQEALQELQENENDNPHVQRELNDSGLDHPLIKNEAISTWRFLPIVAGLAAILLCVLLAWRKRRRN